MAEKNFNNVRIVNKHDTETNWQKATGFIPKQGELIVYDIDENYDYERIKIGDGVQNVNDLPFAGGDSKNVFYATMSNNSSTASKIVATVDDKNFAYKAGTIVALVCTKSFDASVRTVNINKLGAVNLYTESTDSTFTSIYGYSYAIDAYDVLLLLYDTYNHFVVLNNTKGIIESQLSVALQSRIEQISTNETNIESLSALVGDTSVAEQISEATYTQAQVDELIAAVKQFCLPKIRSITLTESNWVFSANYYYQDVPVGACTPTSKVDLQPTYSQLATWQDDGLAFTTQSRDGIVRVWAIPEAPREDITVQISVQEVLGV